MFRFLPGVASFLVVMRLFGSLENRLPFALKVHIERFFQNPSDFQSKGV